MLLLVKESKIKMAPKSKALDDFIDHCLIDEDSICSYEESSLDAILHNLILSKSEDEPIAR